MLGSYSTIGEGVEEGSFPWGPVVAVALLVTGGLFAWRGRWFLQRDPTVVEYYEAIVLAVGIALLVRTFIIEPFKIPSGSMIPTLLVGDYLFVSKFAYGHRIPFTRDRLFMGDGPKRGDIAVFEYPRDPTKDYIKRIIGLPGDRIVYQDKRLYINDQPVAYEGAGTYTYRNERGAEVESALFDERIQDASHSILVRPFSFSDQITDEVVPPGHYFVMGDNRDNSNDSRFWGFVPAHRLVGRALAIFWSWDDQNGRLRWERLGTLVR
ncbi:MAG: signal peptidase I [Magnetococcales bacterium]|nr:signal peptidase I [Magnetococcales bacterium]